MRKEAKKNQRVKVSAIHSYHSGDFVGNWYFNSDRAIALDDNYQRIDGHELAGYGLEIELECNGVLREDGFGEIMGKIIMPNFKFGTKMFKLESDGSLGGRTSCEMISQVMTKARIRNDYAAYRTMYDHYFPMFGIKADAYNTHCGMHVNVSNALFGKTKEVQDESIRKLYYLVNKFHKFFAKAFWRDPENTYWCGQMTESHLRQHDCWNDTLAHAYRWENAKNIDLEGHVPTSHNNCINLAHYMDGRIEIRLVGGQKNYFTFRNTMETVFHVVENLSRLSWADLEDLTKVFEGCNQYVMKRLVECVGYDGFTGDMYTAIGAKSKVEDLDLHIV